MLSEEAVFQYKCDDYYAPEAEDGIAWDDPALGIDWRIPEEKIILSGRTAAVPGCRMRRACSNTARTCVYDKRR